MQGPMGYNTGVPTQRPFSKINVMSSSNIFGYQYTEPKTKLSKQE